MTEGAATVTPYTRDEAKALVLADNSPYAVETITVEGVEYPYFRHGPKTLADLFRQAETFGDKPFLVFEDERLSYGEAFQRASALAAWLRDEMGVRHGDRVAVAMRNYPEWPVAMMAIASIGGITVGLNGWWTGEELQYGLSDSGTTVALVDGERYDRLKPLAAGLECKLAVTRPEGPLAEGVTDLASIFARTDVSMPDVTVSPDDDAIILYTSGSTGRPKGAVSTHRAVIGSVLGFESAGVAAGIMRIEDKAARDALVGLLASPDTPMGLPVPAFFPATVMLVNVPLFHVTGCHLMLLPSYRSGRKLVLMRKWDADEAVRIIERERVTHMSGVPTLTWDLINSPEFKKRDTSSLISLGGGGAARPPEQVKALKAAVKDGDTGIGYGMTETNALATAIGGDDYLERPSSVGRPLEPLVRMKIIDEAGNERPTGEPGEICIFTPTAIRGYWNRPQDTKEALVNGWIHTGDIGHLDEEGFLFITDRAKDIIIRGGENIGCSEVEAALVDHPSVYEAAAYGVPDERLGERLEATVYLRPGTSVDEAALQAHVRSQLAGFKVPARIDFSPEQLPRLATEKINRRALREAAASREN